MYEQEHLTLWRAVWLGGVALGVTVAIIAVMYALGLGFFSVDTKVNNHIIQPQIRSRLDNDANYRRSIEAQAQGYYQLYTQDTAKLPQDVAALKDFEKHAGPGPYAFNQAQTYDNLLAVVQGDEGAITNAVMDYNALVNNPDNAGLTQFDPSLPPSLSLPQFPTLD